MIDPGTGVVIASSVTSVVALTVGVGGALIGRRTTFDAQQRAERAKALVRVLHIMEITGKGVQDRIFNSTLARQARDYEPDPITGVYYDPYAPARRLHRDTNPAEIAEAAALMAAYGSIDLDHGYRAWLSSLSGIDAAYLRAEEAYYENAQELLPEHFDAARTHEEEIRDELGRRIRDVLRHGRVRRFWGKRTKPSS